MVLLGLPVSAHAAGAPCDGSKAHVLDFWIGDWKVTDAHDGSFQGHDLVDKILGGCAIVENWKGVDAGDEGKSLFVFDAAHNAWEQVWVTLDTSRPGGLKHKRLIAATPDGSTRFQGEIALPDGRIVLDRTTLTPLKDGRVHQVIENSKDGGENWIAGFDANYSRN